MMASSNIPQGNGADRPANESLPPEFGYRTREDPPDVLYMTFLVTENCNLNCTYCFEKNKSKKELDPGIAKAAVKKYLQDTDVLDGYFFNAVHIDFSGGEPLLNFELIKEIVSYVHAKRWPKKHSFGIGTNGTILTDEIRQWLLANPCVSVGVSIDGTRESHNLNRSNSYDQVINNLEFFKKNSPDSMVKMTIGPDSIKNMAQGVIHLHNLGVNVAANVIYENVWGDADQKAATLRVFEEELDKLVDYYTDRPELAPPYLVAIPLISLMQPREKKDRYCGSGRSMVTIDAHGTEYPCHRFSPLGSARPDMKPDLKYKGVNPDTCDECPLLTICPCCVGFNYEVYGSADRRTTFHCQFIKLQVLAAAKLLHRRVLDKIKNHPADSCDGEWGAQIKREIEAILFVQEHVTPKSIAAS